MKELSPGTNTSVIEKDVKNKWRWSWMQERSSDGMSFEIWCRKIDSPGVCFCVPCNKTIVYGSSGKKALFSHAVDEEHKRNVMGLLQTTTLDGASKTTVTRDSLGDRVSELKTVVCSFLAEHCLPFSLGSDLVELGKRLASDGKALHALTLSRGSTTYSTVHGVAHALKEELSAKLSGRHFSLNVDEATNANNDKIVNVLIQYYDEQLGKVVAEHLGSREVNVATAENIYSAVSNILSERKLSWSQVVSCLMDNCNTMRGQKGGVEALIKRQETGNKHLLDIGGENIHVIHTSTNNMFKEFDDKFLPLQDLAMDLYYDTEQSPKASQLFQNVQEHLCGAKGKKLIRPISNRFLQMKDVADRPSLLMDPLIMYYSAFLTSEEQKKLSPELDNMLLMHATPEASRTVVNNILSKQKKQAKSNTNEDRKERILLYLFNINKELNISVELYRGVLNHFSRYVKLFQSEKPLGHKLHAEMLTLTKTFFSTFLDPSHIPQSAADFYALDIDDSSIHLHDRLLGVGEFCFAPLQECVRDGKKYHWLNSFFKALRSAYIAGAKGLLKLPLLNKNLSNLSCLDPGEQRSSTTVSAFNELAEHLPNVVPKDKLGQLDEEVRKYVCDGQVTHLDADETAPDFRLDVEW